MKTQEADPGHLFDGKRILITGGTGSLGRALVRRLLSGEFGRPERITVFSRDEAKQYDMRLAFHDLRAATEEVIYLDSKAVLHFRIGDVRDFPSLSSAMRDVDIVFHAAALKQVPSCEYFPYEAVATNILGVENIVRAIDSHHLDIETVIGISTDKACKPINVMGMTKALQERLLVQANLRIPTTRFMCVRYGNVLASRGSVLPLFHSQIRAGGPVTITIPEMTRFFLSLRQAVGAIVDVCRYGRAGETFVPRIPATRVIDLARALIDGRNINVVEIGIRPGEKIHEILVSEGEAHRTVMRGGFHLIRPMLPELVDASIDGPTLSGEYSSQTEPMSLEGTKEMLCRNRLRVEDEPNFAEMFG